MVQREDGFEMFNTIIQMLSKTIPPEEELRETYRARYTGEKRQEMFEALLEEWKAQANYTINQRALDAL
jgi:hypothetical protein